jgi:hypothetical protein
LSETLRRHGNQVSGFDANDAGALKFIEFTGLARCFDNTVGEECEPVTGSEIEIDLIVSYFGSQA